LRKLAKKVVEEKPKSKLDLKASFKNVAEKINNDEVATTGTSGILISELNMDKKAKDNKAFETETIEDLNQTEKVVSYTKTID